VIAVKDEKFLGNHHALRPPSRASNRKRLLGQEACTELPVLGALGIKTVIR
jgi:hypothetical protein